MARYSSTYGALLIGGFFALLYVLCSYVEGRSTEKHRKILQSIRIRDYADVRLLSGLSERPHTYQASGKPSYTSRVRC